jgi:hypothetical protein
MVRNRSKRDLKGFALAAATVFTQCASFGWVLACTSMPSLKNAGVFPAAGEFGVIGSIRSCPIPAREEKTSFSPEELQPLNVGFVGEIQSIDDTFYPNLDFVVRTRSTLGQNTSAADSGQAHYRYVRIRRRFHKDKSEGFFQTNVLIRHALSGDDEIGKLDFRGRYHADSLNSTTGVDGSLDLTAIWFHYKDTRRNPPGVGFAFEGVIGGVYSCGPVR